MPQDRTRHVLRDTLLVAAASATLIGALEGGARLLGIGAPERPDLPPKAPGVFRIVALGGSTVLGVPDGSVGFVTQLAEGLPALARGRDVEVLNLGRSGAPSSEVRELFEATRGSDPDLAIVLMGHNEFIAPRASRGLRGALQRIRDASHLLRGLTPPDTSVTVHYGAPLHEVDEALRRDVSATFRENLEAMVGSARARGVPLFLCTAPANLAEWPPARRHVIREPPRPDLERERDALDVLAADGNHAALVERATRWIGDHGEDAWIRFRLAVALRALGRHAEAGASFELALENDPVPRRALGLFNQAMRAFAGTSGVRVVDLAERFASHAAQGLVGFELVCDNCHPTPLGNALIAVEVAQAMAEEGLLLPADLALPQPAAWLAEVRRRSGGPVQRQRSHLRWLLSNAIYAMKTPFYNFEASRMYLEQARALAPGDWRIHANLGTLSVLEGDLGIGRRALARAAGLKGEPLDPEDRALTPYLKEALERLEAPSAGGS
jgi:lysophospholipase L1-like esterase